MLVLHNIEKQRREATSYTSLTFPQKNILGGETPIKAKIAFCFLL